MSVFTKYDAPLLIQYHQGASEILEKDYWVVTKPFSYYVGEESNNQVVEIPVGYLTDGASVPKAFWGIIPPWGSYGQAAVLHDYLCDYEYSFRYPKVKPVPHALCVKEVRDKIFLEAMEVLGVPKFKRNLMYYAVRFWSRLNVPKLTTQFHRKLLVEHAIMERYEKDQVFTLDDKKIQELKLTFRDNGLILPNGD